MTGLEKLSEITERGDSLRLKDKIFRALPGKKFEVFRNKICNLKYSISELEYILKNIRTIKNGGDF